MDKTNIVIELEKFLNEIDASMDVACIGQKEQKASELESKMQEPGFWQDRQKASDIVKRAKNLKDLVSEWKGLRQGAKDLLELAGISGEDEIAAIVEEFERLKHKKESLEKILMFPGRFDELDAYLEINAGAGGTEACDWVSMLLRMYERWAEQKGYDVVVIDILPGEEAGLKNVMISVKGPYAYGHLKCERGVHRLVRISPFDANKRRHTSFASVDVVPIIEEDIEVEIRDEDLRIDVFRSTGPGGQGVNTADSAVRVVHLPTGITITCRNERSQLQNKETALKMLKARLYEIEEQKRKDMLDKESGQKKKIEWGSQIRSYILQPYSLVKDHRTNYEVGNVQAVLDGDIDGFIFEYIKQTAEQGAR